MEKLYIASWFKKPPKQKVKHGAKRKNAKSRKKAKK